MAQSEHTKSRGDGRWEMRSWADPNPVPGNRNFIVPRFTWADLQATAQACYSCGILLSGCRGCFDQHGIQESDVVHGSIQFVYPAFVDSVDEQDVEKNLRFLLTGGRRFEVELFALEGDDDFIPKSWDSMPVSQRTSPATNSAQALRAMQGWITECENTHGLCESSDNPVLPTRVVDCGEGVVKLIETNGAVGKYICLSHCWGHSQIITTTKSTFKQRLGGIAWEDLSKTFQDAISLTRALGFKYIWIDSLCIVQDDSSDWGIESGRMASIYSDGHLTIAATHASNGQGGLFHPTEDFEVCGKTPGENTYRLYFRERIEHHIEMTTGPSHIALNSPQEILEGYSTEMYYPLLTRAWVYQERMLSTRVLHFGRYEPFLECKTDIQCECGSIQFHGSAPAASITLIKIEYADTLWQYQQSHGRLNQQALNYHGARLWRTMVSSYTTLRLTKLEDRLPAIRGLAKQMGAARKSRYLAGMWEDTLNDDLLWTIYQDKKPRPCPRNAPSWSWASVETPASYWDEIVFTDVDEAVLEDRLPYQHFGEIAKCETSWSTSDGPGTITWGSLTIRGLIAEGVLEREAEMCNGEERMVYYVTFPDLRLPVNMDCLLDPRQTDVNASVLCLRMSLLQQLHSERLISLVLKSSAAHQGSFERIGALLVKGSLGSVGSECGIFRTAVETTVVIV
ncbi:heterokaryon incompatibility protein-domain-containing protein [Amylocarpus encephaloides]|uniref:Heterokaryon incompatibility protein-domain-containing protein n=1 Tax=Amylocarpus encephaloides TaxID=45428 RepID=A0A9P7YM77_9HELO|nr:heterokaryon incompatibility protein-domain-containing protein [Amylocarpus encephaloides]